MSLADTCIFFSMLAVNNYKMKLFQMILGSSPENFKGFGTTRTVLQPSVHWKLLRWLRGLRQPSFSETDHVHELRPWWH